MNPDAVRKAAAEYFNEGFESGEIRRILRDTDPALRVEAYEARRAPRSVPDGCFRWVEHLVWLESVLDYGVDLTAEEAQGLVIVKRERARFQSEHPYCSKCGMPNEAHALRCRECMAEMPK